MTIAGQVAFPGVDGRFEGQLDPDRTWTQGPGVYGGLVAAAIGSALEASAPGRPLRALSLHLCAPVLPGPIAIEVREERKGAAVTFASARLLGPDGLPAVIASATLARERVPDADFDSSRPPPIGPPDTLPSFEGVPGAPVFTRNFQMRFFEGVPFSGFAHARSAGWLRPKVPEAMSTPLALALLDVWPLAMLPRLPAPRPAASVVIHFQLLPPLPELAPTAWTQVGVHSDVMRQGYSDQTSTLWDATGRVIGRCQQLVALVR